MDSAMSAPPLLTLPLRGKKDAILVRHKARQVASLLGFDAPQQACIAAGTFVIAVQALELGEAELRLNVTQEQLHICAVRLGRAAPRRKRNSAAEPGDGPFRLVKPLPQGLPLDVKDLTWLVQQVEISRPQGLFREIIKQNQEILTLLHELRLSRAKIEEKGRSPHNPNAA